MEMEQKVCSKILTLEEELADIRMERTLPSKLCSIENDISNIRSELKDINCALLSNKTNASQDERNIPHAEDGGMAAKHPINSFQQSKVHTEMPESTPVAQSIENLQPSMKDHGSTGDRSMLASKTLLRKTGGRDIYAQHSLQ